MMEEIRTTNSAFLCGCLASRPQFSHISRGEKFYKFPMDITRLSGTVDTINIVARESVADFELSEGDKLWVNGEVRSFNNKLGDGPKLVISVFAKDMGVSVGEDENQISLTGTICKAPTLRYTPMGREICDIMLAVNRRYGRSDYLPCIAWGANARRISRLGVGDAISLEGRIQSRKYTKFLDDEAVEKTAYEVSVVSFEEAEITQFLSHPALRL